MSAETPAGEDRGWMAVTEQIRERVGLDERWSWTTNVRKL